MTTFNVCNHVKRAILRRDNEEEGHACNIQHNRACWIPKISEGLLPINLQTEYCKGGNKFAFTIEGFFILILGFFILMLKMFSITLCKKKNHEILVLPYFP